MPQSNFGVGWLFATPQGANPTVSRFARLQDVSVDWEFENKLLYGSLQFPVEQAFGKGKIGIKATQGVIDTVMFNTVMFGETTTSGQTLNSVDEKKTVPASVTYTVAATNAASFSADLGVYDNTTGLWLSNVSGAPAAGQYSQTAGVYTVNSAAASHVVYLSYTYSSTAGTKLSYTNQLLGTRNVFGVTLVDNYKGIDGTTRSLYVNFPAVVCPKLSMPLKLDDYTLPQLDLSAGDDGTGAVFNISTTG
jgi:hypothetical protein